MFAPAPVWGWVGAFDSVRSRMIPSLSQLHSSRFRALRGLGCLAPGDVRRLGMSRPSAPAEPCPGTLPSSLQRVVWLLLIVMSIQIGRAAVSQNVSYIDLKKYANLEENPPFQNRILMAPVLHAAASSRAFGRVYDAFFRKTVASPMDLAISLVNCASLLLLLPATLSLRRAFGPPSHSTWLAPLLTMIVLSFTYVVRYEQDFMMPYDMLSVFLYTLGLLAIVNRSGWLFLLVMAVGTPNRETVLFLVPVWLWLEWREGRMFSALAYGFLGGAIWVAWRVEISHILRSAMAPYDFPWKQNFSSVIFPVHWPQLLSVFGFLAIPMWLLRDNVRDPRLRAMWVATLPFLLSALVVGVWRETRIFGELSALVGITFAIQLEEILAPSAHAGAECR